MTIGAGIAIAGTSLAAAMVIVVFLIVMACANGWVK
jgi:hypothetical protein